MRNNTRFTQILENEQRINRWEQGVKHHPKSLELMQFLSEIDYHNYGDYFNWNMGGDGDNGETLMFQMDAYFEAKDKGLI